MTAKTSVCIRMQTLQRCCIERINRTRKKQMTAEAQLKDAPHRGQVSGAQCQSTTTRRWRRWSPRSSRTWRQRATRLSGSIRREFDKSELERFEVTAAERAAALAELDAADPRRHRVRHRQRAALRRGAARRPSLPLEIETAARPASRPPRHPDRARRLLRAGRALSAAVGADHDDRAGQGRRGATRSSPACRRTRIRR